MAYADLNYYTMNFFGDILTECDAAKWLLRASDELDMLTFGRLSDSFPANFEHADKVKKAVCAIAEALALMDSAQKAASISKGPDGEYHGAVVSISSGRESKSYQNAASAVTASMYAAAAADPKKRSALIKREAAKYLANVPDANGTNLLYAGEV